MTFTIDTNVIYYSVDRLNPDKREIAGNILRRARFLDCFLVTQVLGEFLSAVRRKSPDTLPAATDLAREWSEIFAVFDTGVDQMFIGAGLAERYKLQFWDSVILAVARAAGAEVFLTEDMQDGATIEGVTLVDPFRPSNRGRLDALLGAH